MLYISSDLYIDAINLILNDDQGNTKQLTNALLNIYDKDSKVNASIRNHTTKFCINILRDITSNNVTFDNKDELLTHLLKYKNSVTLMKDETTYLILEKLITRERRLNKNKIEELTKKIQNSILWYNISKQSREMIDLTNRCSIQTDVVVQQNYFDKIKEVAKGIIKEFETIKFSDDLESLSVERVDFSDKESIRRGITKYKKLRTKGMSTGIKGLNRMFGKAGGPVRGESICVNALMHNYKTGMLLSFARWMVKYATPELSKEEKKPLILFISLENQAEQNLMELYRNAYETLYQESADLKTDDEIVDYIFEYFNAKGFTLVVERKMPNEFGYDQVTELVELYESKGYEIYGLIVDYMNNMKKESIGRDKGARTDLLLRWLYADLCNYTKNKNITLITAHQLNRDAQRIASSGTTNVVKRFNSDMLADGMDPQREVDFVVYIHIEIHPVTGQPFLTMMCRKHRYVNDTEEKFKYLAVKFTKFGIEDDLNLEEDTAVYDIYASDSKSRDLTNNVENNSLF